MDIERVCDKYVCIFRIHGTLHVNFHKQSHKAHSEKVNNEIGR